MSTKDSVRSLAVPAMEGARPGLLRSSPQPAPHPNRAAERCAILFY